MPSATSWLQRRSSPSSGSAFDLYVDASDPWFYAREAFRLARGKLVLEADRGHPFPHRLGLILPIAGLYRALGVSERTTLVFPLASAIALYAVVYFSVRTKLARILAVGLALMCIPVLRATTELGSDLTVTPWMALAALMLSRRSLGGPDASLLRLHAVRGAVAATALTAAFLTKETALWLAPVVVAVVVRDARAKQLHGLRVFYGCFFGLLVLYAGVYLWACGRAWGDPLVRFHSIEHVAPMHLWGNGIHWLRRLTIGPLRMFFTEYGLLGVTAAVALFVLPESASIWKWYTAATVLFFWVGPTSLRTYAPLPLFPRFSLPCAPGLIVLSASLLGAWWTAPQRWKRVPVLLVLGTSLVAASGHAWKTLRAHPPEKRAMAYVVQQTLASRALPLTLVCADRRTVYYAPFYFGFEPPAHFRVLYFPEYRPPVGTGGAGRALGLTNAGRSSTIKQAYGAQDYDAELARLSDAPVFDEGGIRLAWLH